MSGVVRIRTVDAARAYPVVASATVRGGQLVEATTGGVQKAGAASFAVLGVAQKDGFGAGAVTDPTTNGAGQPFVDGSSATNPSLVTVEKGSFKVTYAAGAVVFGDRLKAAANGTVAKWVRGTDAVDLIVGYCNESAGVAGGGVFEARITGNA